MKFLGILASVQAVVLLLLFMKVSALEERAGQLTGSGKQIDVVESVAELPRQTETVAVAQDGLDSQQLRRILRQELQAALNSSDPLAQNSPEVPEPPVFDDAEMQYQQDILVKKLDSLKGQDEVSSGELDMLMGEIARLDPERRTEMFKMVNRAMNSGEIKGRL